MKYLLITNDNPNMGSFRKIERTNDYIMTRSIDQIISGCCGTRVDKILFDVLISEEDKAKVTNMILLPMLNVRRN